MTSIEILLDQARRMAQENWGRSRPFRPGLAMRIVLNMTRRIRCGVCHLVFPDGQVEILRGVEPGPEAICVIHRPRLARRLLVRGMLGFCESYLEGDWSSPDMTRLFEVAMLNEKALAALIDGRGWWRRLEGGLNRLRGNSRAGSRRNIAQHYDLGNAFYAQWLDPSMTYSSGIFADRAQTADSPDAAGDAPLQRAQELKYQRLAQMLDLKPHHRLLEIGCGWGGFAEYAARTAGCHVTGLTLSRAQHDYARQRIAQAGLSDKVSIELCDYRDVRGEYDRIASIEMFEAVGEKYWDRFFSTVSERLRPGGVAAMQVITIAEHNFPLYRRGADYIQKYIFPGGFLPTFTHLRERVGNANLQWGDAYRFGEHYARTLAAWQKRFLANWPKIVSLGFDERFRRMWEQYLSYCEAGFRAGTINVCQFSFTKPDTAARRSPGGSARLSCAG